MRRSTVGLLVLVAGLSLTSVMLWRELHHERLRTNSFEARPASDDRPQESGTAGHSTAPVAGRVAPALAELEQTRADMLNVMLDESRYYQDETYREAQRRYRLLELKEGHIEITKAMGISRETADQLLALLVNRELSYLSAPHPNPRNEEERQTRRLENERLQLEEDAEIAAVIGELNVEKWHRYQASLPFRHQVRELRLELADGPNPLPEDQVEPLIDVIQTERKKASERLAEFKGGLAWSEGMEAKSSSYLQARRAELDRETDKRILAAAGSFLSRDQLEVLLASMRRDRELQAAASEARRAMIEAHRLMDARD
jgi:hypothetical protein